VLYLDVARARHAYEMLAADAGPVRLRYATKANHHPALLGALAAAGAQFAIMSLAELEAALAVGVPGSRLACMTPGPPASLLRRCREIGVRSFTVDTAWEARKLAALVPEAEACLAIHLEPRGRLVYPRRVTGARLETLGVLLAALRGVPIALSGIAVHVGSQCEQLAAWGEAIREAAAAWQQLQATGYWPRVLSLGGGVPVAYCRPVPPPSAIFSAIHAALRRWFPVLPEEVWLEPGRYVAAPAGALAATVLAREEGGAGRPPRLMLDVGRYDGLPEAALGIRYPYRVPGREMAAGLGERAAGGGAERHTLLGPLGRLDPLDRSVWLPRLGPGERLFVLQTGAYTGCQATFPADPGRVQVVVLPSDRSLDDVLAEGMT
jgi:ornithine decarboxylase